MSISRSGRRRTSAGAPVKASAPRSAKDGGPPSFALPPTVTRETLLDRGSDRRFRALVNDLLTIATRMESVREHHGRRMGISGPQYSVLIAVAHLQGDIGVSVGAVAQALHVSSAFIAVETGKLARLGLVLKRRNPLDRRGVLLSLALPGRLKIDRASAEIRAVNDLFFGGLRAASFRALCAAAATLVEGSRTATQYLDAVAGNPDARSGLALEAAG
jgi:MarR family transcriptional regulator, organic hydroperoxide resistance regulator